MRIRITESQRILLLLESKIDNLIVKYCDRLKKVGVPCDDDLKSILNHIDRTPTKKYLEWIIKKIILVDPELVFHNSDEVFDYINRFDDLLNKNQLKRKDINSYEDYEDLQTTVLNAEEKKSKKDLTGQYEKFYEDDQYLMIQPLTKEASCRFGVDTKWCISAKFNNKFERYIDDNEFFFVIKKGTPRDVYNRLAIQLNDNGNITVWDAKDNVVKSDILKTLPSGINTIINDRVAEILENNLSCFKRLGEIQVFQFAFDLGDFDQTYFNKNLKGVTGEHIARYDQNDGNDGTYFFNIYNNGNLFDFSQFHTGMTVRSPQGLNYILYYIINQKKYRILNMNIQCGEDSRDTAVDFVGYVNSKYSEIKRHVRKLEGEYLEKDGYTYWSPFDLSSNYTFEDPSRAGNISKSFIEYVKKQNEKGEPATRNGFLKHIGREPRKGYLSKFFASIKDAGIVKLVDNSKYVLGPNYEKYLQGKLKRKRINTGI